MMTMEQRRAWIVGDEVDLNSAESRHVDRILDYACGGLFAHLGNLKAVTMDVNGVVITTLVGHRQAIVLSRLRGEQRIGIRPGLAVDRPAIVAPVATRHFLEEQIETFVGQGYRPALAEDRIVPLGFGRRQPLRLATL